MTTIENDAALSDEQLQAVREGLMRMNCPAATEVLISSDFVGDVREIIGSTTYSIDRGTGMVGAKTIPLDTGHSMIVVNGEATAAFDCPTLARMLAHESGHVLLNERGEDHADDPSAAMGDRVLRSLAATAIEETESNARSTHMDSALPRKPTGPPPATSQPR